MSLGEEGKTEKGFQIKKAVPTRGKGPELRKFQSGGPASSTKITRRETIINRLSLPS